MVTLFDSARVVKSAHPFARGVSARRECRMPYSAADLEWAAQHLNDSATAYDVVFPTDDDLTSMAWAEALGSELDRMAGEFEAQDRHERGYCL